MKTKFKIEPKSIFKYTVVLVIISTIFGLLLTNSNAISELIHKFTNKPYNVTISNLSPNSVSISWYTEHKDQGFVFFELLEGENVSSDQNSNKSGVIADDRTVEVELMQPTSNGKFYTHHVTISKLDPDSTYTFSLSNGVRNWDYEEVANISSQTSTYFEINSFNELKFKTPKISQDLISPSPLFGRNVLNNMSGEFYKNGIDSIVYLSDETGNVISMPANYEGYWIADVGPFMAVLGTKDGSTDEIASTNLRDFTLAVQTENITKQNLQSIKYVDYNGKRVDIAVAVEVDEDEDGIGLVQQVSAAAINCNQDRPAQTVSGAKGKEEYAKLASNWLGGRGKNYAIECYDDVVCTAKENGVNPTFTLWIWLHESGASNYTAFSSPIEDFGIHRPDVTKANFNKQIDYFMGLRHENPCSDLDFWTGWATNFLNGSCDITEKNFLTGETGPEYLASMKETYSWVSSGGLPSKIKQAKSSCGGDDGGGSGNCSEQCPGSDGILRSCTPSQADGTADESLCNSAGRVQSCGNVDYCCPGAGGDWTTDMSKCPNAGGTCGDDKKEEGEECDDGNTDDGDGCSSTCKLEEEAEPEIFELEINPNATLISVWFAPIAEDGERMRAADFMEKQSSENNDKVEFIAEYKAGKWNIYQWDDEKQKGVGKDFEIIPGYGYFIMAEKSVVEETILELEGFHLEYPLETPFVEGWNLIGTDYNVFKSATVFLDDTKDAVGVSYWDSSLSRYAGIIKVEDDIFGDTFKVEEGKGYFVLIGKIEEEEEEEEKKGRCCQLTISNGKIIDDWEDEIPPCEDAWEIGRSIYDGTLESVKEIEGKTKETCN